MESPDGKSETATRAWAVAVTGERFRQLRAKYPQYAAGMLGDEAPVIRIRPERIVSWGGL